MLLFFEHCYENQTLASPHPNRHWTKYGTCHANHCICPNLHKVTDPTGTPLNARATPNGKVIGQVKNGTTVYVSEYDYDDKGRPWVLVFHARTDRYIGWVFREFISCY